MARQAAVLGLTSLLLLVEIVEEPIVFGFAATCLDWGNCKQRIWPDESAEEKRMDAGSSYAGMAGHREGCGSRSDSFDVGAVLKAVSRAIGVRLQFDGELESDPNCPRNCLENCSDIERIAP